MESPLLTKLFCSVNLSSGRSKCVQPTSKANPKRSRTVSSDFIDVRRPDHNQSFSFIVIGAVGTKTIANSIRANARAKVTNPRKLKMFIEIA